MMNNIHVDNIIDDYMMQAFYCLLLMLTNRYMYIPIIRCAHNILTYIKSDFMHMVNEQFIIVCSYVHT